MPAPRTRQATQGSRPAPQQPAGSIPADIGCAQDYELLAAQFMAPSHHAYVAGGSGQDVTLAANPRAFARWQLLPRLLRDVTDGHTRLALGTQALAHPVLLAPVALQTLAHPLGELETARAAAATDTCMVASTLSSHTLEDIARAAGPQRWFQLYFQPRREATLDLVRRAERAGYGAIVVTLDAALQVPSLRALRTRFRMPADCVPANLAGYEAVAPVAPQAQDSRIFQGLMRAAPTWRPSRRMGCG